MVSRRKVLALLGLGGAGVVGYTVSENDLLENVTLDEVAHGPSEPDTTAQGERSSEATGQTGIYGGINKEMVSLPTSPKQFNFDYKPVDEPVDGSSVLSEITAEPTSNRDGDRLRLKPAEQVTAEECANILRDIWLPNSKAEVTTALDNNRVVFSGGVSGSVAVFVGVQDDMVLVARATQQNRAKALVENWSL